MKRSEQALRIVRVQKAERLTTVIITSVYVSLSLCLLAILVGWYLGY
jgi:hypothetical protein